MRCTQHIRQLKIHVCVNTSSQPVGEQDAADVQKQRRDRDRSFHLSSINAVCHL